MTLHFLVAGTGPPIFLLHASPMNAYWLTPLLDRLAKEYTVIALDTPGYGSSEAPLHQPQHLKEYASILYNFQQKLELSKVSIYGSATGAQLGIRFALDYPDEVNCLFLDNAAHFTSEEREEIFEHYFPDFTPQENGIHLEMIWDNVIHLFQYFPWCFQEDRYKLSTPLPPTIVLHRIAIDYIKSGSKYDWAYRAAFAHEERQKIAALTVPTHIFSWDLSIVKPYIDRIFEIPLPSHITSSHIASSEDRYQHMSQVILEKCRGTQAALNSDLLIPANRHEASAKLKLPAIAFPDPELSGQYLVDAWNTLTSGEEDIDQRTALFVKWAESIL